MFGDPGGSAIWRLRRGSELSEIRIESRFSVPDPITYYQLAVPGLEWPSSRNPWHEWMYKRTALCDFCRIGRQTRLRSMQCIPRA